MTKQTKLTGRELDIAVAKAMGLDVTCFRGEPWYKIEMSHVSCWEPVPSYTGKRWNGMRLMMEWLLDNGLTVEIECHKEVCGVILWLNCDDCPARSVSKNGLPEAVALALLQYTENKP